MSLQPSNFGLHVSAFGYVWDVDTLSVVPMRQPVIATDTLNVDADVTDRPARQLGIVTIDGTVPVTQSGTWVFTDTGPALRFDGSASPVLYLGTAAAGSADAAAVWQIQQIDTTSGVEVLFADGNTNYDNIWNNRAGLSYS